MHPGASVTERPDSGPIKFKLAVKLGPVNASFAGDAELERDPDAYRGLIRGSERDQRTNSRRSVAHLRQVAAMRHLEVGI